MQVNSIGSAYSNYSNFKGIEKSDRKDLVHVGINGAGSGIGKNQLYQYIIAKHGPMNAYSDWRELSKCYKDWNLVECNMGSMKMKNGQTLYKDVDAQHLLDQLTSGNVLPKLPDSIKMKIVKEDDGNTYLEIKSRRGGVEVIRLEATRGDIDWSKYNTQIVVDTTGAHTNKNDMGKFIQGTVKQAVVSAPAKDDMLTIIPGINDWKIPQIEKNGNVVSAASCTTTCAAPYVKLLDEKWGINMGYLDTTHAATNSQQITDQLYAKADSKNRGSFDVMIPTTTGAAKALKLVTNVGTAIGGSATRIPTAEVSQVMLFVQINDNTVTEKDVKDLLKEAEKSPKYKNLIKAAPLGSTSRDAYGAIQSGLYVPESIQVITGKDGQKAIALKMYYDNEFGYTRSLGTLVNKMGQQFIEK